MDTAAREKEIEERLLKDKQAQKERKEVREYFHARKPNRSYFCLCKKIIDLSLFLFLSLSLCSKKLVNRRRGREKESERRLKKLFGCLEELSLSTLPAERRKLKKSYGKRKKSLKRN